MRTRPQPIWQGEALKELLRRGALGEDFRSIAADYGGSATLTELRWREYASSELRKMRRKRRDSLRNRIDKNGPPIGKLEPPMGRLPQKVPFSGRMFFDDPAAVNRDQGLLRHSRPDPHYAACSSLYNSVSGPR